TAPAGGPTRLAADRAYLVTGGLRGLGLRVAEWLVERGARHLVLMGRQAPDARALAVIEGLRGQGAQVLAARGDVARRADLQRVLAEAAALAPLAGVVHAAGVLDDGVIAAQTWPRFATVMGPKVRGSWNLHTLCPGLDFLVLFSSGASVAGPAGQSNHAAANAFEDALAWYRQARGLPTVSINWGPWAEIGAAADRRLDKPGSLRAIAPADGLAALDHAMRRSAPGALFPNAQLAVLDSDWAHLADGAPPLFGELLRGLVRPGHAPAPGQTAAAPEPSLRERLASAAANRRKTLLRDHVRQLTVKVLGLQRGEDLDVTEPLRQLGLDSLMAVELRNRLGQAVGRTLPATLTFDHPSVAALTEHLAREVFADLMPAAGAPAPQGPAPDPAPTPAAAPDVDAFDELSEDELAQQLMRRLDGLG
ncbi:MAG: SDR family NAD(P)-dependent oxidoreductase, partial [Comamonadaceae bacterium]|nr:SDR family NAD(P)-dependent oxidoreductase [Comamonadaceae bacterium]